MLLLLRLLPSLYLHIRYTNNKQAIIIYPSHFIIYFLICIGFSNINIMRRYTLGNTFLENRIPGRKNLLERRHWSLVFIIYINARGALVIIFTLHIRCIMYIIFTTYTMCKYYKTLRCDSWKTGGKKAAHCINITTRENVNNAIIVASTTYNKQPVY
jgi:hypothetical protein